MIKIVYNLSLLYHNFFSLKKIELPKKMYPHPLVFLKTTRIR